MTTSLQQQLPLLHRRPLPCRSSYQSCTGDHLPEPADTSSYKFCTSSYHPCTGDLPAAAITSSVPAAAGPAPAITFLRQQTPATTSPETVTAFMHQRSPSCTSRHQQLPVLHQRLPALNQWPPSCASDHLPAPADTSRYQFCTSNYQSWTSDHLPAPADTSPKPETIFLHQRKIVLHPRPPIQRILVLYQVSRSWSNDHHPAPAIVRRTLFRFTTRHNKVWPFEATPLFCHSCLVRCQSFIFQKFAGTDIFIWPLQQTFQIIYSNYTVFFN